MKFCKIFFREGGCWGFTKRKLSCIIYYYSKKDVDRKETDLRKCVFATESLLCAEKQAAMRSHVRPRVMTRETSVRMSCVKGRLNVINKSGTADCRLL